MERPEFSYNTIVKSEILRICALYDEESGDLQALFLADEFKEIYRIKCQEFNENYRRILSHAMSIRHRRIVTFDESLCNYLMTIKKNKMRRTLYHGVKIVEEKRTVTSNAPALRRGGSTKKKDPEITEISETIAELDGAGGLFEPETEND